MRHFRGQRTLTYEERCIQLWDRCSNTDDLTACWVWQGSRTGLVRGDRWKAVA